MNYCIINLKDSMLSFEEAIIYDPFPENKIS